MSNDDTEALMEDFDRWKAREAKKTFLLRMEHKLNRKEKFDRSLF
jgi:hypothetical protein